MLSYIRLYRAVSRLKDWARGSGVYALKKQLDGEQFLSPNSLLRLQERRLNALVQHAIRESPYYRRVLRRVGLTPSSRVTLSQLPLLPLLRREDLQTHVERIRCPRAGGLRQNASGGSTGQPVVFYHDGGYARWSAAHHLLFLAWMGIAPGDRTAVFWGADQDIQTLPWRLRLRVRFDRMRILNSFAMSEAKIATFVRDLEWFRPRYVFGYASSLYLIARFINSAGRLGFRPHAVHSSAETLYPSQRAEIEEAFGCPVYNLYGSREINHLAAECSLHRGLHVFASGRVLEIVDDRGQPVPDGQIGLVAVTDLTNLGFPFIRYLTGDLGIRNPASCLCGRCYPLLERVVGRRSDMIVLNGQYIHGEFFAHLLYGRREIRQFQVIQETGTHLLLRIAAEGCHPELSSIVDAIREKVGTDVSIDVQFADSIEPLPSGKHCFVVSKVPLPGFGEAD